MTVPVNIYKKCTCMYIIISVLTVWSRNKYFDTENEQS